ncbi:alpha/beta-hydrolase [Peniophora sp. CONT]|nr:alpha/beta-hydrolase [Peniophora sp. CONT]
MSYRYHLRSFLTLVAIAGTVHATSLSSASSHVQVTLNGTTVIGKHSSDRDVDFFGGIKYGHAQRFEVAEPYAFSNLTGESINATNFGKACFQPLFGEGLTFDDLSDDCLNINIFRPARAQAKSLPVLIWIYGGAYVQGDSSMYDGANLVARSIAQGKPILFASINYRLGPWGFPQGIAATTAGLLNLGLKDQLLALQWVQDNIEIFGGDPTQVTIVGQSAGGGSIQLHHLNPAADHLFRASIMQSPSTVPFFNGTIREAYWAQLSLLAGCPTSLDLRCLQEVDDEILWNASLPLFSTVGDAIRGGDYPFVPNIDGDLILGSPAALESSGSLLRKPFIIGTNLDEGTTFAPFGLQNESDFLAFLASNTNPLAGAEVVGATPTVLALYPDMPSLYGPAAANEGFPLGAQFTRASAVAADAGFLEPVRFFAQAAVNNSDSDVYVYRFSAQESVTNASLGVTHGVELPFLFEADKYDDALSNALAEAWIGFVVDLEPSIRLNGRSAQWPRYTSDDGQVVEFVGGKQEAHLIPDTFELNRTDFIAANPDIFAH